MVCAFNIQCILFLGIFIPDNRFLSDCMHTDHLALCKNDPAVSPIRGQESVCNAAPWNNRKYRDAGSSKVQ